MANNYAIDKNGNCWDTTDGQTPPARRNVVHVRGYRLADQYIAKLQAGRVTIKELKLRTCSDCLCPLESHSEDSEWSKQDSELFKAWSHEFVSQEHLPVRFYQVSL